MIHFRKYHGLGNDYLVIDPVDFPFVPTPEAVRAVCDRNYGVGSDGILLGPLGSGPTLRIFNPDGSEAEKSGNGLRIFAWYLFERGYAGPETFPLITLGGPVTAAIVDAARGLVEVDMGRPDFDARRLAPTLDVDEVVARNHRFGGESCRITCVATGNPHCVVTGPYPTEELARRLGPLIENDPLFPARTNVQFLEVLNTRELRIEIWERGAGYTLASGASSCAAAAAARRLGLVGDEVTVHVPGGKLEVRFQEGSAHLTGPVEKVFEGAFAEPLLKKIR